MKAIIVDDEPKAIELLKNYLAHFNAIQVIGAFRNGLKAFEFLNTQKVDLIFLDINMPHLSGMSLSRMIEPGTRIVFTTAYSEFAVESYEVKAFDYLLKPISLERFTKTISKLLSPDSPMEAQESLAKVLMIKSGNKVYRVLSTEIFYLEKNGNYMIYHLEEQKIMARESIAQALAVLPPSFLQIQKSYIINTDNVDYFNKEEVSMLSRLLPIGNAFKESLLNKMKK